MKKLKDIVKKNPEPARGRFGVNPSDPWSAKYGIDEDLTTSNKSAGDSRSKVAHSPTAQRAAELEKAAKFYIVKTPTAGVGSKVHHEEMDIKDMQEAKKPKLSAREKLLKDIMQRRKASSEFQKGISHLPQDDRIKASLERLKKSVTQEEVKGELKKLRDKEYKERAKEIDVFNKKVAQQKEEVESIDEISKDTLKDYMNKSADTRKEKRAELKAVEKHATMLQHQDRLDQAKHLKGVIAKRSKGYSQAFKRLHGEETEQIDELKKSTVKSYLQKKTNKPGVPSQKDVTGMANATVRLMGRKPTSEEVELDEADRGGFTASWRDAKYFGKGVPTNRPMTDKEKAEHEKMKQLQKSLDDMGKSDLKKEEVEQIDELSKDTLQSYFDKSIQRRSEIRKQHRTGQMSDADWQKERSKRAKGTRTALRKLYPEETYADDKAAAPSVMAPGEGISEKMTTAKRVMALKKKMVKEDLYDHEKEDKSVKTYGKKPKFDKADKDDSLGEKKPQAAAVLSGGTTLTGSKRDTIEIDPMMRNRPGQPDVTKKDDKKDDKDKDKKKDK